MQEFVADQRRRARLLRSLEAAGIPDMIIDVMARTPRHAFAPAALRAQAYDDCALAIGCGQTISQPSLVAKMLAALKLQSGQRVLDVGCGSGYVTALLAQMLGVDGQVIGLDRQAGLISETAERLDRLQKGDWAAWRISCKDFLSFKTTDESERFDAIHIACTAEEEPIGLIDLLQEGGRVVMPLKRKRGEFLMIGVARAGRIDWREDIEVDFVPMLRFTES